MALPLAQLASPLVSRFSKPAPYLYSPSQVHLNSQSSAF
jgi:hypothetical protein